MKARLAGTLAVWVFGCTVLAAADFWDAKDFTAWSDKEAKKMLTDSPWSRTVTLVTADVSLSSRVGGLSGGIVGRGVGSRGGIGAAGGGVGGDGAGDLGGGSFMAPPQRARLVVRWASALPVKQAMLRRLLNHRASITGDAERLLEQDDPFYRVAVVGVPLEVTQAVGSLRALREATALRRKSLGSIGSVDVRFAYDDDLPTLEFRFPRSEAITLRDREVEFITEFGEARLSATFKLKEMVVGGRLTL